MSYNPEGQPKPEQSEPELPTLLKGTLHHNSQISDTFRFIQFRPKGVRLFERIDDAESADLPPDLKLAPIGDYDSLGSLYVSIQSEKRRQQAADTGRIGRIALTYDDDEQYEQRETTAMPNRADLDEFIEGCLTVDEITEAARDIISLRELTGLDEEVLECRACLGDGTLETSEPIDSISDENKVCDCIECYGVGSIVKYPKLTIADPASGKTIELDLNLAELIAGGHIGITKTIFQEASAKEGITYNEETFILVRDYIYSQIQALGYDVGAVGLLYGGKVLSLENFTDPAIAEEEWYVRNNDPDSAEVPSEHVRGYFDDRSDNRAMSLVDGSQYALSKAIMELFSSAALQAGYVDALQGVWPMSIHPLPTIRDAFQSLCNEAQAAGHYLAFTQEMPDYFTFFLTDESGATTYELESSLDDLVVIIENARIALRNI